MDIHEIVKKLVGEIETIGETDTDNKRFENLKVMTKLVDKLIYDIDRVAMEKDRHEYSRSRSGKHADSFLNQLGIQ